MSHPSNFNQICWFGNYLWQFQGSLQDDMLVICSVLAGPSFQRRLTLRLRLARTAGQGRFKRFNRFNHSPEAKLAACEGSRATGEDTCEHWRVLEDPRKSCERVDTGRYRFGQNEGARLDSNRTDFWQNQQNESRQVWERMGRHRYLDGHIQSVSVAANMDLIINLAAVHGSNLELCAIFILFFNPCWAPNH